MQVRKVQDTWVNNLKGTSRADRYCYFRYTLFNMRKLEILRSKVLY